ncbi:unnamed protein product [Staurois parvus]|uniref:Transposase n=1 Tax=Staurois parvus TaxID=386267 RepID=A0ABN9D071_9NEOB|nr:unnamed protein product [Staurois parvus]
MKKSRVIEWNRRYKERWEDVHNDARSGQPKMQRIDAIVDSVRTLICSDQRLSVQMMAEELSMNWETVWQILKEDFGMRKISAKMVP